MVSGVLQSSFGEVSGLGNDKKVFDNQDMKYHHLLLFSTCFLAIQLGLVQPAGASNWGWNLGSNNPPGATLGLNFMNLGSHWAFEFGVGGVQQNRGTDPATNEETKSVSLLGAVNLKYLFDGRTLRPYIQGGAGSSATVVTTSGASLAAGIGGAYFGGGIFLLGNPVYGYLSYNLGGGTGYFQLGIGSFF